MTTQRPLTQGNKLREPMDQLHEAIWRINKTIKSRLDHST